MAGLARVWALALLVGFGVAAVGQPASATKEYVRSEAMIPVRDGVKLHAVILRPKGSDSGDSLPFLMTRTPYGVDGYTPERLMARKGPLVESGYIFVFEDIRGRYESEGQFVMNRPVVAHTAKTDIDETTDTNDTIDWLLKNVPNNDGKVGVLGISYPGFLAMMAGIDANPAVKAISPQAPMTDVWMGDDFFHNGAFRETYGFDYVQQLEAQKTDARVQSKGDTFDFFLKNVNFAGAAKAAGMENLPTAKRFLTEPSYTKFWQAMAVERDLEHITTPTLEVGGWWDQEDMWGTQAEYDAIHKAGDPGGLFMVLGPWNHGGWAGGPGTELGGDFGKVEFGQPTGLEYREQFEAPFFEYYLKGKPGFDLKGVASFRTGVNQWERYDVWPPVKGFQVARLYLGKDGNLRYEALRPGQTTIQVSNPELTSYVADPADPVPYRHRPIQATYGDGSKWRTWLVEDQRFLDDRKDIARFEGQVLDKDVTVTGDVKAVLRASTTGTDADWIVKLIDVAPDGQQTMIVDEIFRGRYRESFEKPEPIPANRIEEYKWSLHGADHTFLKGHKMLVTVQSSWFPLYDRNPQTYVPNIMVAPASAYKKATVTIYGGSRLEFETPVE
jgi:putative CocE/NonD family hydrolase